MNEIIKQYPSIKQGFGLALYFILFSLVTGFIVGVNLTVWHIDTQSTKSLFTMLGYSGATLLTIAVGSSSLKKNSGRSLQLKLTAFPITAVLVAIVMMLTIPLVNDPFTEAFPPTGFFKKLFEDMAQQNLFAILTSVIAAPILEEVLFRGVILNGFLKNYSPQKAIIISAAIFGGIHLNPWQSIPAFLGGILIGYMYWKTNSIIPGIILHAANNLFCVLISLKYSSKQSLLDILGMKPYILVLVICVTILIGGVIYLTKFFTDNPPIEDAEPVMVVESEEL